MSIIIKKGAIKIRPLPFTRTLLARSMLGLNEMRMFRSKQLKVSKINPKLISVFVLTFCLFDEKLFGMIGYKLTGDE